MLRSEAVSLIKSRLRRDSDTSLDARIISELKSVQTIQEGAPRLMWFLRKVNETLDTVASQETLAVPTDFLREWEEGALWYKRSTESLWLPLIKDDYGANYNANGDTPGTPKRYSLGSDSYSFSPIPDDVYDLKAIYYGRGLPLTTDIENVWLKNAPDLLIAEVGIRIAKFHVRDDEAVSIFAAESTAAVNRLKAVDVAWRLANRKLSMGD